MFKDRLKNFIGGAAASVSSPGPASRTAQDSAGFPSGPYTRPSNGLDQFFNSIRDQQGLSLVDFAGASQANVSFITNMGHRLFSEDYIKSLELTFGKGDFYENQNNPELMEEFVSQNLNFEQSSFDGALVWDALQFLSPSLLQVTVDRLYDILRPNAYLLAFFHANEKYPQVPLYSYRIADSKTLLLTPRGQRRNAQVFNNRGLEKMFHRFQSVKFFLTRDNLREIIIRR